MQDLDEDFTLKGLRQIDVAPGTPVMRDVPIIYCDFSEGSYFAFAQNGPGILIGHRGELAKTLLASFDFIFGVSRSATQYCPLRW